MRSVSVLGTVQKSRRTVSRAASVQDEEVKDPGKLAELLRGAMKRIADLEAKVPADAVEFEVIVGAAAALTSMRHNLNGPVRWFVVNWTGSPTATPVSAPALVVNSTSDNNTLVLKSYVAGQAIIRVERAQAGTSNR